VTVRTRMNVSSQCTPFILNFFLVYLFWLHCSPQFICFGCTAAPGLFVLAALQPLVYLFWLHCSPWFICDGCTAALSLLIVAALQPLVCLLWLHCSQTIHEWHHRSDCIALLGMLRFLIHLYIDCT